MDGRRENIIAAISVITLVILIVIARVALKLSKPFFLIFGAGVAVILAVFAYLLLSTRYNRRRRLLESQLKSEGQELRIEYSFLKKVAGVPIKFRYKELEEATDGFQALIGKGASASVFKGILDDGTSVAVKRIDGEERGEREFRSEVAAIASVHHVNLVRLLGYCNAPIAPRLLEGGGVDERQVKTLVYVALWCVQEKPRSRPSMAQVVDMLEGRVRVELPPDTRMVLVDFLGVDDSATDSSSKPRVGFVSNQRAQSDVECSSTYSLATTVMSGR
ncbi:hypothetical protein ACSQ67_019780 [Phaseolus vulgaris]